MCCLISRKSKKKCLNYITVSNSSSIASRDCTGRPACMFCIFYFIFFLFYGCLRGILLQNVKYDVNFDGGKGNILVL